MGSLRMEEPVHASWSRFCTVNYQASASNRDSNRLKVRNLTATPPSPLDYLRTIALAVLDCKQNVRFIVFCKVVYFTKRIYHFSYRLAEEKLL